MAGGLSLPVDRVRPCRVSEVVGPAVVLAVEEYDLPFLVVGKGDEAVACILGQQHHFEGMPLAAAGSFKGLAIEGVEFEVDLESMYSLEGRLTSVLGSMVRTGTGLELVYKGNDVHGFTRHMRVPVVEGLTPATEGQQVAFLGWRAVVQIGREKVEVWKNTPTPAAAR